MNFKTLFDSTFFIGFFSNLKASSLQKLHNSLTKVYLAEEIDIQPKPVKGIQHLYNAWYKSIKSNLVFKKFRRRDIKISFIVNHNGELIDIDLVERVDENIDKELIKTFKGLQLKWSSGLVKGESVRVKIVMPFRIN
ncbi:hypothetical protein ADIARSV_4347 [Arcticibacter svalbardensis MN12-7]|uniref:TonB C-terminal domain-containing protein n=1 Tax=Arcticibacter svalbardensis MN12-7 TaxID=1150600 RepID=R9GL28_9SPHI|nr:hypothetical protein [Arcticibacter svalbardensis]EOR92542.1 hypothetical protein ADIARSV_4347 [Arcticibacter svalbardensis MN12-7]